MSRSYFRLAICCSHLFVLIVSLGLPLDAFSQDQNEPLRSRILLTPHREAVLSSQIPAKIDSINVEEGDRFKSGQILISLDCVLHRSRRDKAKAERDAASKTLDAQTRLQNMGSGSELELDLAGTTLAKANAEFSVSNAMVKMCSIKAPFRGRVASRKANADRKSTRLNSSHITISYAVFCLKKKKKKTKNKKKKKKNASRI